MNDFPQFDVGTVRGIDEEYTIDWINQDLAFIRNSEGEIVLEFASLYPDGFRHVDDVISQAEDVVFGWEEEDLL